ncbi:MAG: rod shape-determining protein RodA [Gaiellaceae bacterium]
MIDTAHPQASIRARRADFSVATLLGRIDWLLVGGVLALVVFGLWAVSGVTHRDVPGNPDYYVVRQLIWAGIGLAGLLVAAALDPDVYRRWWRLLYLLLLGMLGMVLALGVVRHAARRWVEVGPFQFQPSEFGKVLFVLAIAGFVADRGRAVRQASTVVVTVAMAVPPLLLLLAQPDIGTALVYGAIVFAVLLIAGARWLHLAVLMAIVVAGVVLVLWGLPSMGMKVLQDYQQQRFTCFLHAKSDVSGPCYNVDQSKIAIGSGNLRGRGVKGSTETNLDFLPESRTDFIFAAIGEQRGFTGAAALLLLYLLVVWRGLSVVAASRDTHSAMLAGGIVFSLLFQVFVNTGMTMGIAPVTGVPLPFVSVGGSAMIACLTGIGVLIGVRLRGSRR